MWFLALLALPIFGLCAPLDAIIAKRQVDTSQLRSATRRLTARAGGSSPQPALIGGPPTFPVSLLSTCRSKSLMLQYNCPPDFREGGFTSI